MLGTAFSSQTSFAKAPMLNTQAPYFYRFKLGNFEATIVTDGTLPLGDPEDNFVGLTKPEMEKQLTDNFLPLDNAVLEQNALVVNTGDKLVLFDTGMGGLQLFGPTTGKLLSSDETGRDRPEGYRRRGDEPCAHRPLRRLHGGRRIERNFPNAQYYITQADYDFWTTESNVPKEFKVFWDTASKNLKSEQGADACSSRTARRFLPGVHAIARARPHGRPHYLHDQLRRESALLRRRPRPPSGPAAGEAPDRVRVRYRSKQSAQTRVKMLSMLADNKIPLLAYHFAWPGIGHVAKQGDGFRFYPEGMKMEL